MYHIFFPPALTHSIVEESHNIEQYCDHCDCGGTCVNKAVDFIIAAAVPRCWDISAAAALLFHLRYFILEKQELLFHNMCGKRSTSV